MTDSVSTQECPDASLPRRRLGWVRTRLRFSLIAMMILVMIAGLGLWWAGRRAHLESAHRAQLNAAQSSYMSAKLAREAAETALTAYKKGASKQERATVQAEIA